MMNMTEEEFMDEDWWHGRQWAVTSLGLECMERTYTIAAERLDEGCERSPPVPWPKRMVDEAEWVDLEDFVTVWLVALALHGIRVPADQLREIIAAYRFLNVY
jgi:hypothetical protein